MTGRCCGRAALLRRRDVWAAEHRSPTNFVPPKFDDGGSDGGWVMAGLTDFSTSSLNRTMGNGDSKSLKPAIANIIYTSEYKFVLDSL
jgi:hypothetical protein